MAGKNGDDGSLGRNLAYGLEIAVGVTLGYLVGNWYDRRHGSAPWGLLVGVMFGLASGMYLLIKDAIRMNKD
jgi:F0F1-type ATP synthase assembly protein I